MTSFSRTSLGTSRVTSVSLYYGVSGESRVVTIGRIEVKSVNKGLWDKNLKKENKKMNV